MGIRRVGGVVSGLLGALALVTTMLVAPSGAATGGIVPVGQQVVGGCVIGFDTAGTPGVRPSKTRPCVGVRSVQVSSTGDLDVIIDYRVDDPQVRMEVSPGIAQVTKGITAGATRSSRAITLRFYDDRLASRLDLRRSDHRSRVAGTTTTLGWTGASGSSTTAMDPGLNYFGSYHDRGATGSTTVQGGCVIRFSTDGPWIHANATHHCTGLRSVGISSTGRLLLRASDEQVGSIINLSADPDETLTTRGILAGTSTYADQIHVQLYDTVRNRPLNLLSATDRQRVAGQYSNIWFTWTKTTARPGAVNATYTPALNKYGPYINGSTTVGGIEQTGCEIKFSTLNGQPYMADSSSVRCTGVASVEVSDRGDVLVRSATGAAGPVVGTSTVSSRRVTDYGVRAGISGGSGTSTYTLYSVKLGRVLDLRLSGDRAILQRSGSSLYVGWSRIG